MSSRLLHSFFALLTLVPAIGLSADYHEVEHPNANGLLKNTWVLNYQADDFSDKIQQATVLYIPEDYRHQNAFFMRCNDYFTNFSVQYLDHEAHLKSPDGTLQNDSPSFAKHGYVYNEKQTLRVKSAHDSETFSVAVGGQNNHLTKLFKTDIQKQPGLLGMSFYYSFTYKEMPSFRAESNSSQTQDFFKLLKSALQNNHNLQFELENKFDHRQDFLLDVERLNRFMPQEVMEYCVTARELR